MFESMLKEQPAENPVTGLHAEPSIELYNNLAKLEEMVKREDTPECYRFLETNILPHLHGSMSVPRIVKERACRFLSAVSKKRAEDFSYNGLPTVTQITRAFIALGGLDPVRWAPLIVSLTEHICGMSTNPDDYSAIEKFENALAKRELLMQDLVTAWKAFTHAGLPGVIYAKLDPDLDEFRLPRLDLQVADLARDRSTNIDVAIGSLFPQWKRHQKHEIVLGAIGAYVLLSTSPHSNMALRRDASTFVAAVGKTLERTPVKRGQLREMFASYPRLGQYVLERWNTVSGLRDIVSVPSGKASTFLRLDLNQESTPRDGQAIHKALSHALRGQDLAAIELAWADFWGDSEQPDEKKAEFLQHNSELFDYFVMAYTAMHQPARALQVLNSMPRLSLKPTLKTWTSMIEGFKRSKNASGAEAVWRRLTSSGVKLDTAIWTARISCLIHCGRSGQAVQALAEMADLWNEAVAKDDTSNAVKPSIEPVNAAIAGLFRINGANAARKVLGWAVKQGIDPDIITYNTLLRPMVREGLLEEIDHVLLLMKNQGVLADATTFTIVLEGALQQIAPGDTEKQIETVNRVLEQMEQAGLEAKMVNYAKIMHVLLREGDDAHASVKAVLAHMWSKNLKLSSPIYTILVEHYFSRDPPDLAAVKDLIESRNLFDDPSIDRVFWERVIKGFAMAGDTDTALEIFEGKDNIRTGITLPTLEVLLRALVYRQHWEQGRKLVNMVWEHKEHFPAESAGGQPQRFWRHGFWGFAADTGLFDPDTRRHQAASV
ncbi:Glutathione S-transferase-like protein [Pleurostoma richardsiae]|uniref:Glutathione S-transferase-like protein n=1 Tax=Pleurostoma richardsiae TaxID=41990 RepID=A0AA38VC05_9PEZI|nr:Glutathione S-transferase-like protein [Pleurostoma richardsiae]